MTIFGNDKHARGCFLEVSGLAGGRTLGTGARFSVAGAQLQQGDYFISAIQYAQREKFNIVQCFGDRNYVYAFGHDPQNSVMEVTFTAFLTNQSGNQFGNSLALLTGAYAASRISKKPQLSTLSIGACSVQGFWIGMGTATADVEHNLQSFTAYVVITSPQNGKAGSP